jgi:SDR family mycofactocin-dependent oxidoreductase
MGDLANSVAVVTGAARGQGRSHAVAMAAEGADIIAIDRCADIESIPYPLATKADLNETVELVRATGRRAVPVIADVRDLAELQTGVQAGIDELGEVDVVVANAGVVAIGRKDPADEQLYRDIVDTNLNGVWHTIAATVPSIIRKGKGGSIILISSVSGMVGRGGDGSAAMFAYTASKHGVVGLMRSAANAYAAQSIRVNSVHPTGVMTPMTINDYMMEVMQDNLSTLAGNLLPIPCVEAEDVTNAVVWLASPKARYVTGMAMPVDAGHVVK